MTHIKVILTKEVVYTTHYKTIHACERYTGENPDDRYNDPAAVSCKSLAFSLATTAPKPDCAIVDFKDKSLSDQDIFEYLDKCHLS